MERSLMKKFYTVGYEGTEVSRFVAYLLENNIKLLVDVRAVPQSRKPGFSKSALRSYLEAAGISYVHMKHLGDPKPGREAARRGEYALFRRIYGSHLAESETKAALQEVRQLIAKKTICLMCFERDYAVCHRDMVANWLAQNANTRPNHLVVPLPVRQSEDKLQGGNYANGRSGRAGEGASSRQSKARRDGLLRRSIDNKSGRLEEALPGFIPTS